MKKFALVAAIVALGIVSIAPAQAGGNPDGYYKKSNKSKKARSAARSSSLSAFDGAK